MENKNLEIYSNGGAISTNDSQLNIILANNPNLAMAVPAITFEEDDPDSKVYLVLTKYYDDYRDWRISIGRQNTYNELKDLVKGEEIDPNESFIMPGSVTKDDNVIFEDAKPITVFRFLKVMLESNKVLDGDTNFDINEFDPCSNTGDKTILNC